jgi:hypothetical protein
MLWACKSLQHRPELPELQELLYCHHACVLRVAAASPWQRYIYRSNVVRLCGEPLEHLLLLQRTRAKFPNWLFKVSSHDHTACRDGKRFEVTEQCMSAEEGAMRATSVAELHCIWHVCAAAM